VFVLRLFRGARQEHENADSESANGAKCSQTDRLKELRNHR